MQKITADSPEAKSPDLVAENIAKLKELFPELLTEGENGSSVNLDVLKSLVGDQTVTDAEEKYGLNWHGKRKARQLALTSSTGTLRPCPEDSVDWDSTQNLMIEGDNLEVLKLLQKSYAGKVKMIYIDPPYNTGKDFIYPDNFKDNIKNYLELTGQTGEGGNKLSSNSETSGRFHTDWLNMMYPRLKLAKNLLKKEGVLFISIGENEVSNLQKMCDEIMGEENFIGLVSRSQKGGGNKGIHFNPVVDYILCYATSIEALESFTEHIDPKIYNKTETSGPRAGDKFAEVVIYMPNLDPMRGCKNQRYYIQCPDGSFVIPPGDVFPESVGEGIGIPPKTGRDKVWRWIYETYKKT
jgi:adenine-specific DNA-methyltransferase